MIDNSEQKTNNYLAKIGKIIILFSQLEQTVEFFLWELIDAKGDSQNIGRRITTHLDFVEIIDLMRSIIVERYGEKKQKFLYLFIMN